MNKRIVAIDFDGVIHKYSKGWQDGSIYDAPIEGAFESIDMFKRLGYQVVILTARPKEQHTDVLLWCAKHALEQNIVLDDVPVTSTKPPASIYIDDRAISFSHWEQAMEQSIKFLTYEQDREADHILNTGYCWCKPIKVKPGKGVIKLVHRNSKNETVYEERFENHVES